MRALFLLLALAALALSATILTRADQASIDAALPLLQRYLPDVKLVPADPTQWRALIDRGGVDFLWAGAPVLYEALYREGYLAPMPDVPELRQLPERLGGIPLKRVGPDGRVYYVVYGLLGYVIGYNPEALGKAGARAVCSWRGLASPNLTRYYLETGVKPLAIARPTKSTSSAAMMQLVTEIYGWEEGWRYLASMAAVARFVDSSGAVRDVVKRGEALFGPMVDYYVFIAGLDYCIPTDGTDILFDPVAVPRGANMTTAALLTRVFLTDMEKRLVDRYILPGNPAVLDSPDVNKTKAAVLKNHLEKLMGARVLAVPPEKSASYYYSFIYYYEATLVDLQDLLTDVWTRAVQAYLAGKITEAQLRDIWRLLGAPVNFTDPDTGARRTFTYQVAVEINDKVGRDPAYRDKVYQAWREAARERYQRAAQLLESYMSAVNTKQTQPQQVAQQVNTQQNTALIIIVSVLAVLAVVVLFIKRIR
ncbi:ABC transporter substrate-binding protein [Pyrobaculum ferrireducens]|uniref:Extracellular solute-binding protein, family 1 n=1 Tax=Pyrobaculum ferrireducens TaxID=1104324 RepID=G7VAN4_9CREN|nr:ABC transporter substrate-binding protein [Pyrobaculum ferrireducens]AET32273.1 extracellular solute-binding protein, family 1 [Pyrobaculum ferrireducens]